jgi:hypothetical protein
VPGVLNIGAHRRGRMSGASISFAFSLAASWFVGASSTISWTFQNGTPSSASGAGPHSVSFPAGIHEVSCTVISTTGATVTAKRWVFAHDFTTNPPYQVKVLADRITQQGRRLSIELIGASLEDTPLQTGSMVMLWEELFFADGESIDSANGDFVGWVESISGGGEPGLPTVRVELFQALHRLEQIRGFSQVLKVADNPANWQEVSQSLSHLNFYVFYLLYWHTSLLQLFDYHAFDVSSILDKTWANDPGDWYTSVNRAGAALMLELTQAPDGTLYLRRRPSRMNSTDRANVVARRTLGPEDCIAIPDVEHQQFPPVGQTQGGGFVYNSTSRTNTALKAYAPGEVPGQGGRTEQMPDQILNPSAAQTDLNERTANWHTEVNNPYPRITLRLLHSNSVAVLMSACAEMYWVGLAWTAAAGWPEGVDFNGRGIIADISIQWNEDGTRDTTLSYVNETNGLNAPAQAMPVVIDQYTDPGDLVIPSIDPDTGIITIPYDPEFGLPPVVPLVPEDDQPQGIAFAWSAAAIALTYHRADPTWLLFWTPPNSETLVSLVYDPRSPRYTSDRQRGALRLWTTTLEALYYCANALAASPVVEEQQVYTDF